MPAILDRLHRSRMASLLAGCLLLLSILAAAPAQAACDPSRECCSASVGSGSPCGGAGVASQGNASGTNQGGGNPINLITGNKYQQEVDLAPLPGVLGLEIIRHYNSGRGGRDDRPGLIGKGWRLSYETLLDARNGMVEIIQADGTSIVFGRSLVGLDTYHPVSYGDGVVLAQKKSTGTEYLWVWNDGR
ncbi:MAG: hypothetical protein JWP36_686, partial [Paucimonas sp.]|nr:hypothetical protein [Paucimonas sp.]